MKKNEITLGNLNKHIAEATEELLNMAKEAAWNHISSNVKYVIRKIKLTLTEENLRDEYRTRALILEQKERLNFASAIQQIRANFGNIYLIELYIFKSDKKETIVEIGILDRTELEINQQELVKNDPIMLHCKVAIPPYFDVDNKDKFDINWQLETFEYKRKMFWWHVKNIFKNGI